MASQRTVRDTANSFYVVATNAFGTAWAHHFIRNVGGSDVTDTGGTWPCWRYCGTAELPAYTSNPKLPAFIYSEDTGSQDYAVKTPSGTQFLGSYHGGDVISLSIMTLDGQPIDPTIADYEGESFSLRHISTATNAGNSYTIELLVFVNARDGNLSFCVPQLSSNVATFQQPFFGMVIGTSAWDEMAVTLQGGSSVLQIPVPIGTTWTANAWQAAIRQSSSGRIIRVKGNHPQQSWFRRTRTVRNAGRTKFYFEAQPSLSFTGRSNIFWSVEFEKGGAPGPIAALPANLVLNGAFTTDLNGWTATHTASGGSITQSGGKARFSRGTSGDSRLIQPVTGLAVGSAYLLTVEDATSAGAMGQVGLTSASNGSTSTPAPAFPPDADDSSGYNARLVIPTLSTHYVMLKQDNGTAGQTTDFDNVGLYKL